MPRWPVTISYFDKDKAPKSGEQTPVYAIGFELYENGISRALSLDYNDFVVAGKLTSLEIKDGETLPLSNGQDFSGRSNASPLTTASSPKRARTRSTRVLGLGGAAVDEIGGIGLIGRGERAHADAEQAESRAVGLAFEQVPRSGENPAARVASATASERARVRIRKSAVLSFSVTVAPAKRLGLQPRRNLLRQAPEDPFERAEIGDIAVERRLRGHALGFAIGADFALVDAAREAGEAAAFLAVAAHQLDLARPLQIGDAMKAVARKPRRARLADAEDEAHRLRREKCLRLACAEHRKAARLVEVGGDFGEEFVAGEPDRDGDAEVLLDVGGKPRQHLCRRHAVQPLGAGEIEKSLVDRQRLDQRRQSQHHPAHLAADAGIFLHVRPDHLRACGHSRSASNIGMADFTPKVRAT